MSLNNGLLTIQTGGPQKFKLNLSRSFRDLNQINGLKYNVDQL